MLFYQQNKKVYNNDKNQQAQRLQKIQYLLPLLFALSLKLSDLVNWFFTRPVLPEIPEEFEPPEPFSKESDPIERIRGRRPLFTEPK